MVYYLLYYISKPIIYFDTYLKYSHNIYPYYIKSIFYVVNEIKTWSYEDHVFILYLLQIIPRMILLSIFVIDVLWLHYIYVYYYFLFLTILPLIYRYFRYSLQFALEQFIIHLEALYDEIYLFQIYSFETDNREYMEKHKAPYHDKLVSLKEYIKIQYDNRTNIEEDWYYEASPLAKENIYLDYCKKHNKHFTELTEDDRQCVAKDFNTLMPLIRELYVCLEFEKNIPNYAYISLIKALIFLGYFLCWAYILLVSFHTVENFDILNTIVKIINKYYNFEEPFTGLHNYNINMSVDNIFINYIYYNIYYCKYWSTLKIIFFIIIIKQLKLK